jgi:hypothetical protein
MILNSAKRICVPLRQVVSCIPHPHCVYFSCSQLTGNNQPGVLMGGTDSETVQFVGLNIIVIVVVLLFLFAYLVLLIRKRWKANFLHPSDPKKEQTKGKQ